MSKKVASFPELKELRLRGLKYIQSKPEFLSSDQAKRLQQLITDTDKTQNITQLGAMITLQTPNSSLGYVRIEPLTDPDPKNITCAKWGSGPLARFYMYGQGVNAQQEKVAFTLCLTKLELAAPCIVAQTNLQPTAAVIWCVNGGVGVITAKDTVEKWYAIPHSLTRGIFECNSKNIFTFRVKSPSDSKFLHKFVLSSRREREIEIDLEFTPYFRDAQTTYHIHQSERIAMKAILHSTIDPVYNGPGGCTPVCKDGIGTILMSYTNMRTKIQVKSPVLKAEGQGLGWFHHQYFSGEYIASRTVRFFDQFFRPKPVKWIWICMQFYKPETQWQIHKFVNGELQVGQKFNRMDLLNYYDEKGQRYSLAKTELIFTVEVLEVQENTSFIDQSTVITPCKYKVGIADSKNEKDVTYYILIREFGSGENYSASGNMEVSSCGRLMNEDETVQLGNCFISNHHLESDEEIHNVTLKIARGG